MVNQNSGSSAVEQAESILKANCHDNIMEFDTSDGGNADAFVELYGNEFLYVKEIGWLHWNGKYWELDDGAVMLAMRTSFDTRHDKFNRCGEDAKANATKRNTHKLNASIEQAQSILVAHIDDFDKNPDELNVDNGVLNLKTWKVTPHESTQLFTYCIDVPFDEQADMSAVVDFMETILTEEGKAVNQELVDFTQTALGYSITGHTREEKLFYLYGKLGRNGKGSITEAMMELLPYPIAQEVDFNTFISKRDGDSQNFDLADQKASRIIFASESNKYQMLNPATIKKLTGGNYIRAAHKYKEFFTYRPQYAPWLSSNHKVNGDPDDNVLWNRVLVIEFPNSYLDREDKLLKERLKSPEVQNGLLRWLAIGARRWYQDGLEVPKQVKLATKKQQEELDTFTNWFDEALERVEGYFTTFAELYQNYKMWCEVNGVTPKAERQFTDSMQKKDLTKTRSKDVKRSRGYDGIKIVMLYGVIKDASGIMRYIEARDETPKPEPEPNKPKPRPTYTREQADSPDFDPEYDDYDIED